MTTSDIPSHFMSEAFSYPSIETNDLTSFLNSHYFSSPPQPSTSLNDIDYVVVHLINRPFYSDVEISFFDFETLTEHSRKFNIDLNGPRALFLPTKPLIYWSNQVRVNTFKSIDASFLCEDGGRICDVPDSRAAIFMDKSLRLLDKNKLMGFFKLVQQHLEAASENGSESESESFRILHEDLESFFVDFLKKNWFPNKIKSIILYAIAMVDYDQEELEVCKDHLLKTKDGINCLLRIQPLLFIFVATHRHLWSYDNKLVTHRQLMAITSAAIFSIETTTSLGPKLSSLS